MNKPLRWIPVVCCLFLVPASSFAIEKAAVSQKRLNVLFLLADDQRPDTIAALGNEIIETPHLDSLVENGFVFENAYCMGSTSPAVCNPSRHMIQSGMSLFHYKVKPDEQTPSMARAFRAAGYETYHHSKKSNTAAEYHKHYEHSHYLKDQQERLSGHHGRTAGNDAVAFLKERDPSRPFFMYVGFAGPHDPRVAAEEWMQRYQREEMPLAGNLLPFHPFNNGEMLVRDERLAPWPRTPEIVQQHLHDYYSCITSIDHHIGRILQALKETGEYENTIIVFSADHGLALGSHGLFGKQNLYEHSMKAPMIFSGPGISAGQSAAFMYLLDLFPTMCDLAGLPVPAVDGVSQKPVIMGQQESVRDTIYLAYKNSQRAVRKGDWKLIRYPLVDVTQLFNVKSDPEELHDLSHDPAAQAHVPELMKLLAKEQKRYDDLAPLTAAQPAAAKIESLKFFE